ncbi:hypothetical protein Nmel_011246 [Mimus melanotis]
MLLTHDNLGTITTPRILPHRTAALPAATCLRRQYTKTQSFEPIYTKMAESKAIVFRLFIEFVGSHYLYVR